MEARKIKRREQKEQEKELQKQVPVTTAKEGSQKKPLEKDQKGSSSKKDSALRNILEPTSVSKRPRLDSANSARTESLRGKVSAAEQNSRQSSTSKPGDKQTEAAMAASVSENVSVSENNNKKKPAQVQKGLQKINESLKKKVFNKFKDAQKDDPNYKKPDHIIEKQPSGTKASTRK